jgi:hypothetical protein
VHVTLNVPQLTKAGSGLELYLYAEGEKLGQLDIGRGGIYWRGGNRRKVKRISWSRFAEMLDDVSYD